MANVDTEGLARIKGKEHDNQHMGRGQRGYVHKDGTRGTGKDGNGSKGGGINRSTVPTPQH